MKKLIPILIILNLFWVINAAAQLSDEAEIQTVKQDYLGLQPASTPFSLIDLSRVKWSQSYSVSFFSGGGTSGQIGLYTGSLFYEFTPSLSIDVGIGIAHNPGALVNSSTSNDAQFYPSFNLDYHPSENFRLSVGFARVPGYYHNPYGYYNPYGYSYYDWRRNLSDY